MVKLTRLKEFLSLNGFEMEKVSRDVIPCDKTKKVIDTYKLTKNNKIMYLHVKMSGDAQFVLTGIMQNGERKPLISTKGQNEFIDEMYTLIYYKLEI